MLILDKRHLSCKKIIKRLILNRSENIDLKFALFKFKAHVIMK